MRNKPAAWKTSPLLILAVSCACNQGSVNTTRGLGVQSAAVSSTDPVRLNTTENGGEEARTTRHHPISNDAFGPVYGSGCPVLAACGCDGATNLEQEFNCQLNHLNALDIPITAYLFDGDAWSSASSASDNTCSGTGCCSWRLGDQVVNRLKQSGVRALLHFWGGCHNRQQYQRAYSRLDRSLLGFYLDDGSSDADVQDVVEFMQSVRPADSECALKAYQNRQQETTDSGLMLYGNVCYVGDLPYDFEGLRVGIARVLSKAPLLPAPFNEFTGYAYLDEGTPDEETYSRRLHFGCFQPVMAHTPYANSDPWLPRYSRRLIEIYQYYAWLHKELVPYFYSYAYAMHEDPQAPVLRSGPASMPYSYKIGEELFVAIVTDYTETMRIVLPPGEWLDYWDESRAYSHVIQSHPVPYGQEPIFIKNGSILALDVARDHNGHGTNESQGSLTVLVYPKGVVSFRYRDDHANDWITFQAELDDERLTITAAPHAPDIPVLYRIGRWNREPASVAVEEGSVTVNQGGSVARVGSEVEVNAATNNAWYYDAAAQRLIVKSVPASPAETESDLVLSHNRWH